MTNFFFLSIKLEWGPEKSALGKLAYIDIFSELE